MGWLITVSTIISCFASAELGSAWWLSACRHGPLWRLTCSWCSRQKILILIIIVPIILILNKDPSSQPALYEDEGLPQLEPSLISPSRVRVPLHWICAVQNNIERNTYYNILPYHTLYYFYHSPHTTPLPRLGPEATCPLNFPNSNASILRKRTMIIIALQRIYAKARPNTREIWARSVCGK